MILFYVTHPSKEAAMQLCDTLLQERLIACYNLLPIESVYRWRGEKLQEKEIGSLLKTRPELADKVEEAVTRLHSYEVPCIMRWEVQANAMYENWIIGETRSVALEELKGALAASWSKETCYPGCADEWGTERPMLGQCSVTSLVIQEYLGGDLLSCTHANHIWNRLPDGTEVDLTREQFPEETRICIDLVTTREKELKGTSAEKAKTAQRYGILKDRVARFLSKQL